MSTLLTEEEKKKQKLGTTPSDSNYQEMVDLYTKDDATGNSTITSTPSNTMTLDEWYGNNLKSIQTDAQRQKEDAYVNMQLLNKYLPEQLAHQGLSNTGVAGLYANQNNIDYRNQIANINANAKQQELDLYNQYYAQQKAEEDEAQAKAEAELKAKQDAIYSMYINDVNSNINGYNYIDDDVRQELYDSFDWDAIGEDNAALLQEYLGRLEGSTTQRQDKWYNETGISGLADKVIEIDGKDGDGNLNDEQMELLRQYAETQKPNMSDAQWKEYMETVESYYQSDEDYIAKNYSGIDTSNYISVNDAGVTSFGTKYNDAGTGEGSQDSYVKNVIKAAKNGKFKNGDLIDFDYGKSQDKGNSVYMYYNGKFYKTNKKRDDADVYVNKKGYLYMYGENKGKA